MRYPFPRDADELKSLVEDLDVSVPYEWSKGVYDREEVIALLVATRIWENIPNPNEAEEYIASELRWFEKERARFPQFLPYRASIYRNWLDTGVKPEDICKVVMESKVEMVFDLLSQVAQANDSLEAAGIGLALVDTDLESGTLNEDSDLADTIISYLMSARPKSYPDLPEWV